MPSNLPPHSERWAPQEPYAQPPPTSKRSKKPWILGVVLGLLIVACGGLAVAFINAGPSDDPGPVTHTVPPPPSHATTAPKAVARVDQVSSGTYQVGTEVKAGTWTTKATHGGPCYWERLKDFSGDFTAIIANGNLDEGEQGRPVVKPSDKGVHFTGPCVWTKE